MKRREVLKAGGIAGILAAAQFPLIKSAWAQDRYAKYKGTTVVMSVPAHPHYDAMAKILPDFTAETGIKVELDTIAMGRMKDKQLLEMAKPQGDYDAVCYIVMWKGEYVEEEPDQSSWSRIFKNAALADPKYDIEGHRHGLPREPRPGRRPEGLPARARAPSSTACPTAPRPPCSPTARTSSTSTSCKPPQTYDEFAEDPARR